MIQPLSQQRRLRADENLARIALATFESATCEEGFRFELVNGVLQVSPSPARNHQELVIAVAAVLLAYRNAAGGRGFAQVLVDPRVHVDDDENAATVPQPDIAAYDAYPRQGGVSYRGVSPALVVEIVSPDDRAKDYVRNPALFARVASICEYWIIDPTHETDAPRMAVLIRNDAGQFARIDIPSGGSYEPARWPGLRIDLGRLNAD